jgi:curved DNA-binding protein CbpA
MNKKSNITLYNVLGVNPLSSKKDIEKAYKSLIIKWAEDLKDDTDKLSLWMKLGAHAYETLTDDKKRAEYDATLTKDNFNKKEFSASRSDYQDNNQTKKNQFLFNCKKCNQKLNVPKDKNGIAKCPICGFSNKISFSRKLNPKPFFNFIFASIIDTFKFLFKWSLRFVLIVSIIWVLFYADFLGNLRSNISTEVSEIIAENSFLNNLINKEANLESYPIQRPNIKKDFLKINPVKEEIKPLIEKKELIINKTKPVIEKKTNIYDTIQCEKRRRKYSNISNGLNTKLRRLSKEIDYLIDNKFSHTLNLSNKRQYSTNSGTMGNFARASQQIQSNINIKKRDRNQFKEKMDVQLNDYRIDNLECFEYRNN